MKYVLLLLVLFSDISLASQTSACGSIFEMDDPYFYVLKKKDQISFLLGTTHTSLPLSILKPFIQEAIAATVVIAYDSTEPYELLMKKEGQKVSSGSLEEGLSSRLSPEMAEWYRELAQKSMDAIAMLEGHPALTEDQFARAFDRMNHLPPSTALSVIYESLIPLDVFQAGDPLADQPIAQRTVQTASESLHKQVIGLAKSHGAQSLFVEPPDYLQKALKLNNTIQSFEQSLRFLKYGPLTKPFHYLEGDLSVLERFADSFRKFAVLSFKANLADRVQSWMPMINELHQSGVGVLFALPVEQFVTPYGLLSVLRKNHFKVIRVKTPEQFKKLKLIP